MQTNKLLTALNKAMMEIGPVKKTGYNKHHGYKYASDADITLAVRSALVKHGISILLVGMDPLPSTKKNCEKFQFRWQIAHTSGESIDVQNCAEGFDAQDKACYKAITGSKKYAYTSNLMIATSDDPEVYNAKLEQFDELEHEPEIEPEPAPKAVEASAPKKQRKFVPREEVGKELKRLSDDPKQRRILSQYFFPKQEPGAQQYPNAGFQQLRGTEQLHIASILASMGDK